MPEPRVAGQPRTGAADAGQRELFIYYRVATAHEAALHAAAAAMQAGLRATHPGLQTRLLRRPEPSQGRTTYLEIYARPMFDRDVASGGLGPDLALEIESAARCLAAWLDGERHVEVFDPCA